jgi:parallel beta-helix repeat protein
MKHLTVILMDAIGFTICYGRLEDSGGGIYIHGASPTIIGNNIRNNILPVSVYSALLWGSEE